MLLNIPRLIAKGRYEEARNILMILRASKKDQTDLVSMMLRFKHPSHLYLD